MRFQGFDLNLLVLLATLLAERSVARTADRLNLGQSTISAALARMRTHFNDPLFTPHGNVMIPTALALSLEDEVKEILKRSEGILNRSETFDPNNIELRINVAAWDNIAAVLLAPVMHAIRQKAPHLHLSIRPWPSLNDQSFRPVELALEERGDDFIILPEAFASPQYRMELLYMESFVGVVCAQNKDVGHRLTKAQARSIMQIGLSVPNAQVELLIDTMYKSENIERKIGPLIANWLLVPDMIQGTPYLAAVPKRFAQLIAARGLVKITEFPFRLPRYGICIQWDPKRTKDQTLTWFLNIVRDVAKTI